MASNARSVGPLSKKLKPQRAEADLAVCTGPVEGQGIALFPDFYARGLPPVGDAVLPRPLYLALNEDKARVSRVRLVADFVAEVLTKAF